MPPSQVIKVSASEVVTISRLGYLLSDEACIVADELSLKGETVEVPLKEAHLSKIFNTPRPDMSHWDHSGPIKFAITASIAGRTQQASILIGP
jgi:hypothetical protein